MRKLLRSRVRLVVERVVDDLTDIAVARVERELERLREAFEAGISSYASEEPPDLLTAALGPDLAQMLTPPRKPRKAPKVRTIGVHPKLGKLGVVEREAKPAKPEAQLTTKGAKRQRAVMRCGKCGAAGFRADGCGTSHQPQSTPEEPAASDSDDEPARAAPKRPARNLQATYDMITRAQAGDQTAMTELVRQNIGLVHWMARKYAWSSVPYEDMVQEGSIGLVEAIKRFDVSRGLRLSTYAPQWIRHYIGRAHENGELIRLPVHSHGQLRLVRRAQQKAGPGASLADIAKRAGLHVKVVSRVLDRGTVTQPGTLPDVPVPAPDDEGDKAQVAIAREHIAALPDRLRRVMELRYSGEGMTLREVGDVLGVSRERVRQLETSALQVVRAKFAADEGAAN